MLNTLSQRGGCSGPANDDQFFAHTHAQSYTNGLSNKERFTQLLLHYNFIEHHCAPTASIPLLRTANASSQGSHSMWPGSEKHGNVRRERASSSPHDFLTSPQRLWFVENKPCSRQLNSEILVSKI